jgi:hypothetical protein
LAERIATLGQKHGLDAAQIERATPSLEPFFQNNPRLWRLNFQQRKWNNFRRGDGRLSGDWFDGGWGPLESYTHWTTWRADLSWVPERLMAGAMADPDMVAECFLGLRIPPQFVEGALGSRLQMPVGTVLMELPRKARLELWPSVVEPTLLYWAAPVPVTTDQPLLTRLESVSPEVAELLKNRQPELQVEGQPTQQLRRAEYADYDSGIRWSAAQSPDGLTSARQLRRHAPAWCKANGVRFTNRDDWADMLTTRHSSLMRGTGKHGSPAD